MARKLRVQYPGAIYHLMNRGDRREAIFNDDNDRRLFLSTLQEACEKTDWQAHAFCLMSNHFHLVIETPRPNLVEGMRWLLGVYTSRFNRRQKEFVHVFSGRYKALLVDGSGSGYLKSVCDYVHLNPARAGLLRADQPLKDYFLRTDRLLGEWGIPKDSAAGRLQFGSYMEARRRSEAEPDYAPYRNGWCIGSEEFRQELSKLAKGPSIQRIGNSDRELVGIGTIATDKINATVLESEKKLGVSRQPIQLGDKADPEAYVNLTYQRTKLVHCNIDF